MKRPVLPRFIHRLHNRSEVSSNASDGLTRRQLRAAEANVIATAALTLALVIVAILQWRTTESTARIERAKANPHFRVSQVPLQGLPGFLPRKFGVEAVAGVADATEVAASEIFLIHYGSDTLQTADHCRASSRVFYSYDDNLLSLSLSDVMEKFISLAKSSQSQAARFSIQPMKTVVEITYIDLFERPGFRDLIIEGGRAHQVRPVDFAADGWTGLDLNFNFDNSGNLVVFRVNDGQITPQCAAALRVLSQVPGIKIASDYALPEGSEFIMYKEGNNFDPGDIRITPLFPRPKYMLTDSRGEFGGLGVRKGTQPSYALPTMVARRYGR